MSHVSQINMAANLEHVDNFLPDLTLLLWLPVAVSQSPHTDNIANNLQFYINILYKGFFPSFDHYPKVLYIHYFIYIKYVYLQL